MKGQHLRGTILMSVLCPPLCVYQAVFSGVGGSSVPTASGSIITPMHDRPRQEVHTEELCPQVKAAAHALLLARRGMGQMGPLQGCQSS